MKHKHADLIHAWADGAEIQYKANMIGGGIAWCDDELPRWNECWEYRIKPEEKKPVVRWLWAFKDGWAWRILTTYATEHEAAMSKNNLVKLEWSRTEFPE